MANIKIKNAQGVEQTYNNVNVIKVKNATSGTTNFKEAVGNIVSFIKVSGETYSIMDVPAGVSVQAPQEPTRDGYIFRGWSDVSHDYVPENRIAFPHTFNEPTALYAMWEQRQTGGKAEISGLGSELLTDVTFNISEDFPQSYTEITDDNGDVWIEIPTCYRKVVTTANGQITGKIVSFTKLDDTYIPYSVFVSPTGTLLPYVRFGKYLISSGTKATSKNETAQSMNIGASRALAKERGQGYQLYDWQFRELFNDLAMIKKQSVQINDPTLLGITGWNNYIWIDGFCHVSSQYIVCYDPAKYVDSPTDQSDGYSALNYTMPTSSSYIKKLGYDTNHPFALFPSAGGGSSATYYPDQLYYVAGNYPVSCAVGSAAADCGLFYFNGHRAWSSAYSCRLCYRPV